MKTVTGIFFLLTLSSFFYCDDNNDAPSDGSSVNGEVITPENFSPPEDSSLTPRLVYAWDRCNTSLDSLSIAYKDSFTVEDNARRTKHQRQFKEMQNKICVQNGLPGGYRHYLWITSALASETNSELLDSLQIHIF